MKLVVVESPYASDTPEGIERNENFARACLSDCLARGEAPYCSHLLYTQPGVLRDKVLEERRLGIEAGFAWGDKAQLRVVYTNRGITSGMQKGIRRAQDIGQRVEYRELPGKWR